MAKRSTIYDEPAPEPEPTDLPPVNPDDITSEQDKDGAVNPTSPAEESPGKAQTIEEQGIGPRDPYPTGGVPEGGA